MIGTNIRSLLSRSGCTSLAEATTPWLKEHLANTIARHEQIAAEIGRVSEPETDAASSSRGTAALTKKNPPDDG